MPFWAAAVSPGPAPQYSLTTYTLNHDWVALTTNVIVHWIALTTTLIVLYWFRVTLQIELFSCLKVKRLNNFKQSSGRKIDYGWSDW